MPSALSCCGEPQVEVGDVHQDGAGGAALGGGARPARRITWRMRGILGSTSVMPMTETSWAP